MCGNLCTSFDCVNKLGKFDVQAYVADIKLPFGRITMRLLVISNSFVDEVPIVA